MKIEMKKILNETDIHKFEEKSQKYFEKLENSEEFMFLNYLKKYINLAIFPKYFKIKISMSFTVC